MSTVTESHNVDAQHGASASHDEHAPKPNSYYIKIAIFLAVLTAIETATYWVDFGPFFLPVLLSLMVIKFFTVVLLFMHLKDDAKVFGLLFYSGLALAVFVYLGALLTFRFFG